MLFEKMIGQKVAKEILKRAFNEGRLAGSYLFYGPDGVGKEMAAMDLAMALNCLSGGDRPCRQCSSCRKTASYSHPDYHYLFPRPHPSPESEKRKLSEEIAEALKEKAAKPHLSLDFGSRPVGISIEDIRELQEKLAFLPYEGKYKVALIIGADGIANVAANAFLKILEEPSPTTIFILTTDRPNSLLPTILSRCQKIRFDHLPAGEMMTALVNQYGQPEKSARLFTELSGNSMGRALQMAEQDLLSDRDLAIRLIRSAAEGDQLEMIAVLDEITRDRGKERPARVLDLMSGLVSDLVHLKISGSVVNSDRRTELEVIGQKIGHSGLEAMVRAIERSRMALERNVTPKLCLMAACNTTQGDYDALASD